MRSFIVMLWALLATSGDVSAASAVKFGEAAPGIPAVISKQDVYVYKKMFRYQRAKRRDKVVQLLAGLENDILMGHLIAERLLHPDTKASYPDLKRWLDRYHEQAPARAIYQLANKRAPHGSVHKKPAVMVPSVARYSDPDAPSWKGDVKNSVSRKNLLKQLKNLRQKKYYNKAMRLLMLSRTRKMLGENTWAQVSVKLARSMVNEGRYKKSERLAKVVVSETKAYQGEALWLSGLSSYMQGKKETAAGQFRRLAYSVPPGSRYFAKGAYWAGKAYQEKSQHSIARVFYNLAARDSDSFYGMVAAKMLGKKLSFNWRTPEIDKHHAEQLFDMPVMKRVIALAQIGEIELAQQELKLLGRELSYGMDRSLLAIAMKLGLPNVAMAFAHNLQEQGVTYAAGLYPQMEQWRPRHGYQFDKAMIHAITRQESTFQAKIRSRAGARGLMQIMPNTAKYIRDKQQRPHYSDAALYKPSVNLSLGQTYVDYLYDKFDGNAMYVISSYNAGPGNVAKWAAKEVADPIAFMELIPFKETRGYVRRVMRNLWMYQERFGERSLELTAIAANRWPITPRLENQISLR